MKTNRMMMFFILFILLLYPTSCSQRKQSPPKPEGQEKSKGYLIFINEDKPENYVMYSAEVSGKKKEKVYEKNPYSAAGYSEKVAFLSKESGQQNLYMMNADGSSIVNIANNTPVRSNSLSWSPDGKWLVFTQRLSADTADQVYYVEAGKYKSPIRVTDGNNSNESPKFSNDSKMIVYAKIMGDNYDIYKFDMGKRVNTNLSNNTSNDVSPVVSPDSTKIIFLSDESEKGKYNLFMMNIDGGGRASLTSGINIDKDSIKISPDSSMISFITVGEKGNKAVQVVDMNKSTVMVSNGGYMTAWSGDSKMLYYASLDPKSRKIIEYDITGRTMRDVVKIEYKPGEEGAGIKFLHFTSKLK